METRESGAAGNGHRPRSVGEITKAAQNYEYSGLIGIKYWLRTASALLREAEIYEREGEDEQTYFLLFRHAHLILAHLAGRSDVKAHDTRQGFLDAQSEVKKNLKKLDVIKPRINQRYEKYLQFIKDREARKAAAARDRRASYNQYTAHDAPFESDRQELLRADENKELAVKLAQKEYSRRAASRKAQSSADGPTPSDGDDLSRRLQEIRAQVDQNQDRNRVPHSDSQPDSSGAHYQYPSVRSHQQPTSLEVSPNYEQSVRTSHSSTTIPSPPPVPAKPYDRTQPGAPPRPEKVADKPLSSDSAKSGTSYSFQPAAFLECGSPLRTLFLPPTLRTTFLRLAHKNTLANLETCAFLAGTLIANALFVSKLIVPAQTSTSDTCEMTNESQLFDYVDSQPDLMVLGWIHTHPTQSCFMSSRDLHTHSGYQMMLAESVAVVCAPSKGDTSHGGDWGVYRLTDPPGKMTVIRCEKPGIFHPHDVDNIYTDAMRPGHVVEAAGLEFEVVDLRD